MSWSFDSSNALTVCQKAKAKISGLQTKPTHATIYREETPKD
jgi:hypothetical protein